MCQIMHSESDEGSYKKLAAGYTLSVQYHPSAWHFLLFSPSCYLIVVLTHFKYCPHIVFVQETETELICLVKAQIFHILCRYLLVSTI